MKTKTLIALFSLYPIVVFAACPAAEQTIFHCTTKQQKQIQVCDAKTHITYQYGQHLNQPEMKLKVARQKTTTDQWAGIGPTESYSVNIPNGNTTYSVFSSLDKNSFESTAGVAIYENDQHKATVYCDQDAPITEALFDIDLPPSRSS